jgi:NADH-quinone oxidoreductase subunit N
MATGGAPYGQAFRGMLLSDPTCVFWKTLLLLFVAGVVVMWFVTTRSTMHEGDGPEYFTLLLTATLGMALMSSTTNLLMLVIAVETASLPSYVLAGFRKTHRLGAEASLKYVLFGAASSSIMIYGLSMLYGMYGTLQLAGPDGIAAAMAHTGGSVPLVILSMAALVVGLGFKISVVPLHFWCPDVFEGASIEITAFLSVASKGAALLLLIRVAMVLAEAMGFQAGTINLPVAAAVIGAIGSITATVGNTAAFNQTNIKRLLAWSSIAHAGYMFCGVSLLVSRQSPIIDSTGVNLPVQALLIYLAVYLFMNLGAFLIAGMIYRATGSETLDEYAGLGRRAPMMALAMTVFMFSLVGLPPFAGFFAKLNLMRRLAENGTWWWMLVAVIGVNTVFSLYYYVRVVKAMYLEESDKPAIDAHPAGMGLAMACAVVLVVLFVGFSPFDRVTAAASRKPAQPPVSASASLR